MQRYPITTVDGKKILKDTTFYFSSNPTGGVAIEAQTPGTLREQRALLLGEFQSPPLTYAVFDLFMGRNAIDPVAKINIGAGALYFANGFKLEADPKSPRAAHQWLPFDELKGGRSVEVAADPKLFKLPRFGRLTRSVLVLKGVRDRRDELVGTSGSKRKGGTRRRAARPV